MIKGAYRLRVLDGTRVVSDTGEFSNLICNEALLHGDPFASGFICVGSGNTPPERTNLALENQLAQVSGTFSSSATIFSDGDDRYAKRGITVSLTGFSGDVREVGFRKTEGGNLLSRTQIRDANGLATWVPIEEYQTLEITYFVYVLIPDILSSGSVVTSLGQTVDYHVLPHESLVSPSGYFIGRFSNPFGSTLSTALKMRLQDNSLISSSSVTVTYDTETRECRVIANWVATGANRYIAGFEATSTPEKYPVVELDSVLTLPADTDITLDLRFVWNV